VLASARLAPAVISGCFLPPVQRLIFNDYLDAVITGLFMVLVLIVVADSARAWFVAMNGRRDVSTRDFVLAR